MAFSVWLFLWLLLWRVLVLEGDDDDEGGRGGMVNVLTVRSKRYYFMDLIVGGVGKQSYLGYFIGILTILANVETIVRPIGKTILLY